MSPSALYRKHRRDHLVVPGLNFGVYFLQNQGSSRNVLLAEPNVLAMVIFDESLARQSRTRRYRR